uniref:Uncharacterized protein n=1 Tax=Solanum lycopersicum TaxID=4081 RepID=A0A3Q7G888_SOLLC
MFCVPIFTSM